MTPTVITLASAPRRAHVHNQLRAVRKIGGVTSVLVWVGDDTPPRLASDGTLDDHSLDAGRALAEGTLVNHTLHVPPGPHGLRLAAARNAGADRAVAAGADVLIFLDADCVPGPDLIDRYTAAASEHPDTVFCGPVTYLPPGIDVTDATALVTATNPHTARPAPPPGQVLPATPDQYTLFWSLSFSMTASTWATTPRFDEGYEGYGGEDTDFAFALRSSGIPMAWVGGAHAYHQHHPTSSPPWQHLDDILRNGRRFADRWGQWPMTGWLEAFERGGAVRRDGDGWVRA
ncbi:GT2 family glycosyltransferase [Glaciihabitans tibetensis]|uniref:GT2 family glycosyltransferase n=1 Tax=Glaciihabitans tibetensis TaxID=1266600 RepID=A0A2T0VBX1_9MICO|nr:glycosyltransferase [Glaciihabitans tibetensis]PRY67679.1 GT2 family glycosyltransferase [Glaciihabitans tibetensis]